VDIPGVIEEAKRFPAPVVRALVVSAIVDLETVAATLVISSVEVF
jgi:hypothetical protein